MWRMAAAKPAVLRPRAGKAPAILQELPTRNGLPSRKVLNGTLPVRGGGNRVGV
jgi:hypothetical protein